jgi:hypothetical protein
MNLNRTFIGGFVELYLDRSDFKARYGIGKFNNLNILVLNIHYFIYNRPNVFK